LHSDKIAEEFQTASGAILQSKTVMQQLLHGNKKITYSIPPAILVQMMEFSFFNCGFYLYHDIWRDGVHFMGSFCVCCNFSHQLSFGGSRGLKPTVLGNTCKGWHLLHQCVIILCLFMFIQLFGERCTHHYPNGHKQKDKKKIFHTPSLITWVTIYSLIWRWLVSGDTDPALMTDNQ